MPYKEVMPLWLVDWLLTKHAERTRKGALKASVSSSSLKSTRATFDDPNLVANAGLILMSTFSESLGLEKLIEPNFRTLPIDPQLTGTEQM